MEPRTEHHHMAVTPGGEARRRFGVAGTGRRHGSSGFPGPQKGAGAVGGGHDTPAPLEGAIADFPGGIAVVEALGTLSPPLSQKQPPRPQLLPEGPGLLHRGHGKELLPLGLEKCRHGRGGPEEIHHEPRGPPGKNLPRGKHRIDHVLPPAGPPALRLAGTAPGTVPKPGLPRGNLCPGELLRLLGKG